MTLHMLPIPVTTLPLLGKIALAGEQPLPYEQSFHRLDLCKSEASHIMQLGLLQSVRTAQMELKVLPI